MIGDQIGIGLMVAASVATGVVAGLATVWLGARVARRRLASALRGDLERAVDELLPRLRAEVRSGVEDGAEAVLPRLRDEVEAGVTAAAHRALPEVRDAVTEGIRRGVLDSVTPEGLGRVGEELARRSTSVVEAGLDRLLGVRRDRDDDL